MEGVNSNFGGCQFTVWEAEIVLGVLYKKEGTPKKGARDFGFARVTNLIIPLKLAVSIACYGHSVLPPRFEGGRGARLRRSIPSRISRKFLAVFAKKPLTRVSKPAPGVHGKRGLERGWKKRLAKGWRKVGEGLAKGWHRVGKGLAGFLARSNFAIPEAPV